MSEYLFGITTEEPSRALAQRWDALCKEEGGEGFVECNRRGSTCNPGINGGRFQGWFVADNNGAAARLAQRVLDRIEREAPMPVPGWHVSVNGFVGLTPAQRQGLEGAYASALTRAYGSRDAVYKAWETMVDRQRRYGAQVQHWPAWARPEEVAAGTRWAQATARAASEATRDMPHWCSPQSLVFSIARQGPSVNGGA